MMDDDSPQLDTFPISVRMALRIVVQAPDSYGLVLVLLLVSFILTPHAAGLGLLWVSVLVQATTMLFALHTSRVHRRTMRLAGALFAVAMVLTLATVSTGTRTAPAGMLEVVNALLLA